MPQTQTPELAADLPDLARLEADLQDHLYDQHEDSRDVARIRAAMKQRQKIISALSDDLDQLRAGLHTSGE